MYESWEEFVAAMIAFEESARDFTQELGQKGKETEEAFEESEHSWSRTVRVTCDSTQRSRRLGDLPWYTSGFR